MSAVPRDQGALEDSELMKRLAAGNLSALGILYDRLGEHVRHFVLRATANPSQVDDVTHDAFLGLVSAARRYDPQRPVRSFVIGIAGKLILRERRHAAITARVLGEVREWLGRRDTRTPEAIVGAVEHLARYDLALQELSDTKRVTLIMADFEGMSGAEIASALEVPVSTVWTRLHIARSELRRRVFEEDDSE